MAIESLKQEGNIDNEVKENPRKFFLIDIVTSRDESVIRNANECWDRFSGVTSSKGIAMLDKAFELTEFRNR